MKTRIISATVAGGLVAAALWSAGVVNERGLPWLRSNRAQPDTTAPISTGAPTAGTAEPRAEVPNEALKRLHLFATAPGRNPFEGSAQLGIDPSNPLTYAAGALLENGSTLTEIHADHVVISRDGDTTLLFIDGLAANPNQKHSGKLKEALLVVNEPARSPPTLAESPPTYTDIIRAAPKFENGAIIGFDVYPGTSPVAFARAGLHTGDVLVAVDGTPLTSTELLQAVLKDISDGRSVVATVNRAGQTIDISVEGVSEARSGPALAGALPGQ